MVGTPVLVFLSMAAAAETPRPLSLELNDLVLAAMERNLSLLAGKLEATSVRAQVLTARSSFDPVFTLATTHARFKTSPFEDPFPTREISTFYTGAFSGTLPTSQRYALQVSTLQGSEFINAAALSITQPLLRGAGLIVYAGVRGAELENESAAHTLDRLAETTITAVEHAYWGAASADESERLARASVERAQTVVKRNEELYRLKLVPLVDLITARHTLASREATLVRASRDRRDALEALVFLAYGEDAGPELSVESVAIPLEVIVPQLVSSEEDEAVALARRGDVAAARKMYDDAHLSMRVARNTMLPSLDLTGSVGVGETASEFRWTSEHAGDVGNRDWSLGFGFSFPMGNREARAELEQAKLTLEEYRLDLVAVENTVRAEVRAARRGVESGTEELARAKEAYELSRQQYELGEHALELGVVDTFRLLQYEEDLSLAEEAYNSARYALNDTVTSYKFATARILEDYFPDGNWAQP